MAEIQENAELLTLLERQKDQLFTEDLILDDPEKGSVQFTAFKEGLLKSYEANLDDEHR